MLIFLAGHQNVFSKKIYWSGMTYEAKTSKMTFLSSMSLKRMPERSF